MAGVHGLSMTAERHTQRVAPILAAIGIGLCAFAWLNQVNPPFLMTDDGIRDQLLVRDCTDLGRCHLIGASRRCAGSITAPVWLDLLIAARLLGGDIASQRTVVLALLALSGRRRCSSSCGAGCVRRSHFRRRSCWSPA